MPDKDAPKVDAFRRALGHEIRSLRTLRKLSRPELADIVGISATTLGRIERDGPVDVGDTWRLASALGVEFGDLVAQAERIGELLYEQEQTNELRAAEIRSALYDTDDERSANDIRDEVDAALRAQGYRPYRSEAETEKLIQQARALLDRRTRETRPTRKRAMQQIEDQAARDEDAAR